MNFQHLVREKEVEALTFVPKVEKVVLQRIKLSPQHLRKINGKQPRMDSARDVVMNPEGKVTVHHLGIAQSSGSRTPRHYTAKCLRCGLVVEQKNEPFSIGMPGLYAIRDDGGPNLEIWRVEEPLAAEMTMCTISSASERTQGT
jgi:hypothetical protein